MDNTHKHSAPVTVRKSHRSLLLNKIQSGGCWDTTSNAHTFLRTWKVGTQEEWLPRLSHCLAVRLPAVSIIPGLTNTFFKFVGGEERVTGVADVEQNNQVSRTSINIRRGVCWPACPQVAGRRVPPERLPPSLPGLLVPRLHYSAWPRHGQVVTLKLYLHGKLWRKARVRISDLQRRLITFFVCVKTMTFYGIEITSRSSYSHAGFNKK